jgi:hypothetical protein
VGDHHDHNGGNNNNNNNNKQQHPQQQQQMAAAVAVHRYLKHLRKFLDAKVHSTHTQKAETNESSNLKNKREYEMARFQYIHRLNVVSASKV